MQIILFALVALAAAKPGYYKGYGGYSTYGTLGTLGLGPSIAAPLAYAAPAPIVLPAPEPVAYAAPAAIAAPVLAPATLAGPALAPATLAGPVSTGAIVTGPKVKICFLIITNYFKLECNNMNCCIFDPVRLKTKIFSNKLCVKYESQILLVRCFRQTFLDLSPLSKL